MSTSLLNYDTGSGIDKYGNYDNGRVMELSDFRSQ